MPFGFLIVLGAAYVAACFCLGATIGTKYLLGLWRCKCMTALHAIAISGIVWGLTVCANDFVSSTRPCP